MDWRWLRRQKRMLRWSKCADSLEWHKEEHPGLPFICRHKSPADWLWGGVERVTNKELCVLRSFQQWFPR